MIIMIQSKNLAVLAFILFAVFALRGLALASPSLPAGVKADGVSDDTAAIQTALDAAGVTGQALELPPGLYLISGSLNVPSGVALKGSWQTNHDAKLWKKGTTLLFTGGKGHEDGPAAITLNQSAALVGVTMGWPQQQWDSPAAYPWAVCCHGDNITVENVSLIDAYQGIEVSGQGSGCHVIRNVYGTVLRRGVFVDEIYDIGRLENIHFNTNYWIGSGLGTIADHFKEACGVVPNYTMQHLEAFIFGRADWEYVLNTFVWGARYAYRFIQTPHGACNGQFVGIGADRCDVDVLVDALQGPGIQITNAEFTAFDGPTSVAALINPGVFGPVEFVNCTFWMTPNGAAVLNANNQVTFSACQFVHKCSPGVIVAKAGHLSVNSCSFRERGNAVVLRRGTRAAIVTGCLQPGGLQVDNGIGTRAQISLNEQPEIYSPSMLEHYRIQIGADGDDAFIREGWYGPESATGDQLPSTIKMSVDSARWTNGEATVVLPVNSGQAYNATVWLLTRPSTHPVVLSISGRDAITFDKPGAPQAINLAIPARLTEGHSSITLQLSGIPWTPNSINSSYNDSRQLSARVFAIDMQQTESNAVIQSIN